MVTYSAGSASIKITPSFKTFVAELDAYLNGVRREVGVKVNAEVEVAEAKIRRLQRLASDNQSFTVGANTLAARGKIAALQAQVDELKRGGSFRVDIDRHSISRTSSSMHSLRRTLLSINPATITIATVAVAGTAGVLAELASITSAVAKVGQTVALAPALGFAGLAGIGAAATGVSGIAGAFKAASAASKDSGDELARQRDRLEAISEAEYQLDRANQSAVRSQRALSDVYRDASRSLRDMNDQLVDQKFATQDAALSVQEAAQRLQRVQFDITADATTRARAKLTYDEAVQRLKEQSQKTQDLGRDTAEANRKGVEGSDEVIAAKDRIAEAVHAQTRAEQALAKAREDATKGGAKQDALATALAKLSPNARQLYDDVRALGPAWHEVQQAAQQALTASLGPDVTHLAQVQLSTVREGVVGINTALNSGLRGVLASLSSDVNKADFKTSLDNTAEGFRRAAQGARPLTDAVTTLVTVGSGFLPAFGAALEHGARAFDDFIQRTAADGSLKKFMQDGIDAARDLAQVTVNLGSSVASVFGAASTGTALQTLELLSARMAEFLKSTEGQTKLKTYFDEGRAAMDQLRPLFEQLPGILHNIAEGFHTWSGIMLPFLTFAARLLAEHETLVAGAVTAYLAFKTVAPIVNLVTNSIRFMRAELVGLQNSVGFTTGAMQLGWRQVAASLTVASLALVAVTVAATGIAGEYRKAREQQDALADSSRGLAIEQREMAKAFQESGGAANAAVLDSVATQVQKVTDNAKTLADTAPGAFSVFSGGFQDIKGWFHGVAQAGTDAVHKQEDIAEANARIRDSFNELRLSSKEIATAIGGSNATFEEFIGRLHATGNGGKDAEAAMRDLRRGIDEARQLAKDSTPGLFSLSDAVKVLADESSNAADKVKAMQAALDALSGKPVAAGDALERYNQQVRDAQKLAESFDRTQGFGAELIAPTGEVNTVTANGKLLRDTLKDLTTSTLEAGVAGNELGPIFARNSEQFQVLADRMGLTKQQVVDLAASVGYLPRDIELLTRLKGADDVTQKLVTISELLDRHRDGVTVPMSLVDQQFRDELTRAHIAIQEIPGTKEFRLVPQTADAVAELQRIADLKIADKTAKIRFEYEVMDLSGYTLSITTRQKLHENIDNVPIAPPLPRADGGPVTGGVPGRDSVPILAMPGEHVLTTGDVAAMGGQAGVYRFRDALARGQIRGYAEGGAVGSPIIDSMAAVVAAQFPSMKLTSGLRNTGDDYHTQGKAADFSDGTDDTPGMQSLATMIATNYPGSLELIHSPFAHNIKNGRDVGDGSSTYPAPVMARHRNHVHWAVDAPVAAPGTTTPGVSGPGALPGAATTATGTTSQLYPQAPLPGRVSEQQLSVLTARNAVDAANSERNQVYANPAATAQDRLAADIKYQQAQNQLESAEKSDTSAISVQGIFAKAGSILATGLLAGLGLENSVLSESNVYNRSANALIDRFATPAGPGYGYQPKNLPALSTTVTPQGASPSTIPGSGPITGDLATTGDLTTTGTGPRIGAQPGAGGTERWRPLATQTLIREGFDPAQVNYMLSQIQSESSGDPNAVQQVIDVNSGGNEAVGLLQVIPRTFAQYRDPSLPNDRRDPQANMVAALRYYRARYGNDLSTQWGHGHGYAWGGWVQGTGGAQGDGIRARLSPGEYIVNAAAAAQYAPVLEAINATAWSPARIDTTALSGPAAGSYTRGGHDFSTTIVEPRVADVGDLVALAERDAQAKAIGLMSAMI